MLTDHSGLSPFERMLTLFTRMRPGEGRSAFLFFAHGFLLLYSYSDRVPYRLPDVLRRIADDLEWIEEDARTEVAGTVALELQCQPFPRKS